MSPLRYSARNAKRSRLRKLAWTFIVGACTFFGVRVLAQMAGTSAAGPILNHPDKAQEFPNFAQDLTEQVLRRHPDVLVVAIHAQIPGEEINRVVAINQEQWAKFLWRPSDEIDTDTAKTQRTVVQVIPATHRMEVHMPLHTAAGQTVATLVCVWNFKDEEEAPELMKRSQQIRDEVAPSVPSLSRLLGRP
jgi:hypothetical protein